MVGWFKRDHARHARRPGVPEQAAVPVSRSAEIDRALADADRRLAQATAATAEARTRAARIGETATSLIRERHENHLVERLRGLRDLADEAAQIGGGATR